MALNRRSWLLAAAGAATLPSPASLAAPAPYPADGPARTRALAAKGLLLDVAAAGSRLVAVGERGHVLLSDDAGKTWRQAQAVPTRSTLTCLCVVDARQLWAAGHGGVILRSDDAGEHWQLVHGKAEGPDVLLALQLTPSGQGLAVGGFGTALHTADAGKTWAPKPLLEGEAGEKHLNRILLSRAGSWLVAAEGGVVLRRAAAPGSTWAALPTPYKGSLWCGTELADGTLLLGGMRGNLVTSRDDGLSWAHAAVQDAGSFTGAAAFGSGSQVLLVGVDGTVVQGDAARPAELKLHRLDDRVTLSAVARAGGAGSPWVAASSAGMRTLDLAS